MKITVYELLGLIKDGKAPNKIKYNENIYYYDKSFMNYSCDLNDGDTLYLLEDTIEYLVMQFNYEVEIIEEHKPLNEIRAMHGLPRIENNFTGYKMYADGKEVMSIETITQENKIPEKLKIEQDGQTYNNFYIVNQNGTKCYLTKHSKMIVETLNQVIDYLKSKGE